MFEAIIFGLFASLCTQVSKRLNINPQLLVALLCIIASLAYNGILHYGTEDLVQSLNDFIAYTITAWGSASLTYEAGLKKLFKK